MSSSSSSDSSSAEAVADIEALLKQILVKIPALSLLRFQSVSKHWFSLISDPDFRRLHTLLHPNPRISAFFSPQTNPDSFASIPLQAPSANPFQTLNNSAPDSSKLTLLQSCNGLFLCHVADPGVQDQTKQQQQQQQQHRHLVYVVNPTTSQFRALSSPSIKHDISSDAFVRYALAYDPSESPHYNVVCVSNYRYYRNGGKHNVDIYSSETGEWKHLDIPFIHSPADEGRHHDFIERALHFDFRSRESAVYCGGAVHWTRQRWWVGSLPFCSFGDGRQEFIRKEADVLHYFDIRGERLLVVPATPPVPSVVTSIPLDVNSYGHKNPTVWPALTRRYFGQCSGRLYLIETYKHCMTQLDVMEMERDYSGWVVKYNVDLNLIVAACPGQDWKDLVVLCLSGEEKKDYGVEDCSTDLMLHLPGKVISYDLRNKTLKRSMELANEELALGSNLRIGEDVAFPYMESLACL